MKKLILFVSLSPLWGQVIAQEAKVLDLNKPWSFTIGDQKSYSSPDFDDHNWEKIDVPASWEDKGFANYNGYAWYRTSFDGKELDDKKGLILQLGYIDDVHEAYFNGQLIGFKGSFPPNYYTAFDAYNQYEIPEELINRNSKNVIAVKVYDLTVYGGIVKGDIGIFLDADYNEELYSLAGIWNFSVDTEESWEIPSYNDREWENIIVPSLWRSKYIKESAGETAWYLKEFELPKHLRNKDLYLFLGQIDDFDETYVNGQRIGSTRDGLPFGSSRSWLKMRKYKILKELLNPRDKNTIVVKVEDLGGNAGIIGGPIGLTSAEGK